MTQLEATPRHEVGRVSAEGLREGSDAVTLPDQHMLFRNDGTAVTELTVVRRRDGTVHRDTLGLMPGDSISLPVPRGQGPITVEVHAPETMATTAFSAGEQPPLFSYRDGTVLVARD